MECPLLSEECIGSDNALVCRKSKASATFRCPRTRKPWHPQMSCSNLNRLKLPANVIKEILNAPEHATDNRVRVME